MENAGIALNEVLDVTVSNGVITLVKPFRHKTLEERVAEYDGKLMLDGEIIGCPIIKNSMPGPLHIWMSTEENEGYIQCEKLALLDLSIRGHTKIDHLPISEMINVSDAVQHFVVDTVPDNYKRIEKYGVKIMFWHRNQL